MKTLDRIPTKKYERTGSLLKTGAKLGRNYIRYYGDKLTQDEQSAKKSLNKANAEDVYDSLKTLKGSALKIAQMLSMEKNIMPEDFVEKFSLAQFSVPPLSSALVRKTFRRYFGKDPEDLFDEFTADSVNAASIGQVHKAKKNGREMAVKIQYPGVRDSIASDLKMVKPVAMKMFNIKKEGSEQYFEEVEDKLTEETDYTLELERSQQFERECRHLPNIRIPKYYPELSCDRILTMDWMHGIHFSEFLEEEHSQETLNALGQTLWDFYMYQLHVLKKLHADPHPGNFLISDDHELLVIDFGCVKEIPDDFYEPYFELADPNTLQDPEKFEQKLKELDVLLPEDTPEERLFFTKVFHDMLALFIRPYQAETFDFSDDGFFEQIAHLGQRYSQMSEMYTMNTNRGSRHFIYMNRTFFGLFNMMHELNAQTIEVNHYKAFLPKPHESFV